MLAYRRAHPRSAPFLSLTNFSDFRQTVDPGSSPGPACGTPGSPTRARGHGPGGQASPIGLAPIGLAPWGFAWLTGT